MALPPKDKPPLNGRFNRQPDRRPGQPRGGAFSPNKSGSNPLIKALLIISMVFAVVVTLLLGYAFLVAKPNLPKISALIDYNPKTPKPHSIEMMIEIY
jgi:penicillin-binding protein 1A